MTTQRCVLVVDDDAAIVDFLETALEDEGYQVRAAVGADALSLARTLQPAVILLDINMPGMDGIEVSRRLRDNPATAHIPIIVMSAQDRLRTTGPLLPVNDRLPKPFFYKLRTLSRCQGSFCSFWAKQTPIALRKRMGRMVKRQPCAGVMSAWKHCVPAATLPLPP